MKEKKEPFVIIGGEVHNSNLSTAAVMEQAWIKTEKL